MPAAVIPAPSEQWALERLVQNGKKARQGRGQCGHGGTPRLGALEGPAGRGEAQARLVRDSGGSRASEGRDRSLESCFPWPQDQKAHRPP